jgi:hypothetical protein
LCRLVSTILIITVAFTSAGCANLLEGYVETVTPHVAPPYERPPVEVISVTGYEEFKELLLTLVMAHETEVEIHYHNYDGEDVQAEVQRVSEEIKYQHPVGAYAISDISVVATRLVSYFEVEIEIEYKRTREQIESIVNVATERYMMTQLLISMSEHREEALIRTGLQITDEEIAEFVREIYYQNPRRIVMLPFVTVETFPEEGEDRIYEVRFAYMESPSMMQLYSDSLATYVRRNAEQAVGVTDAEVLLSLVMNLMASTEFDEGIARATSMHGAQNFAATAFGALVRGNAVGEGFAMAFKALCDELRFDCRIVLGFIDGRIHAWNIVLLDGFYYHIDVAMCVVNGLETAFLKTDEDFEEMYTWDRGSTVRCEGELTLYDIIGVPDDPDDPYNGLSDNGQPDNGEDE